MKRIKRISILFTTAILIASCTTISYVPKVSLDVSPKTVNKVVQVEKFIDSSPIEDKKTPFLGLSVTNAESLPNGLDIEVTNAVVSDFSINGVFKQTSRKVDNPDYIIKGEIIKFNGRSVLNTFAKITMFTSLTAIVVAPILNEPLIELGAAPILTWYFGLPVTKNTSEIEIVISLYDKNNTLIKTYSGKANDKISTSMYKNKMLAVPSLTNKMFSTAIMQIREQILNDITTLNKE